MTDCASDAYEHRHNPLREQEHYRIRKVFSAWRPAIVLRDQCPPYGAYFIGLVRRLLVGDSKKNPMVGECFSWFCGITRIAVTSHTEVRQR